MLVDLDTRDIIRLERDEGVADSLREALGASGGRLVLSDTVLDEIIEPLRRRSEGSTVMKLLNLLDSLPLVWVRTVGLEAQEIKHGVRCFVANESYRQVNPFVGSYVDTLLGLKPDHVAYYRRRPLAATMWELVATERTMPARPSIRSQYPFAVEQDRAAIKSWTDREYRRQLEATFERKVKGLVREQRLDCRVDAAAFADHVRANPEWCPSTRVSFGAWHVSAYDAESKPRDSDVDDFVRLRELPYVDVFTCDGARRDQLKRLRQSARYGLRAWPYWDRVQIVKDVGAVLRLLGKSAST